MIATDIKMEKLLMHIFKGDAIEPMRLQDRGKTTNLRIGDLSKSV